MVRFPIWLSDEARALLQDCWEVTECVFRTYAFLCRRRKKPVGLGFPVADPDIRQQSKSRPSQLCCTTCRRVIGVDLPASRVKKPSASMLNKYSLQWAVADE